MRRPRPMLAAIAFLAGVVPAADGATPLVTGLGSSAMPAWSADGAHVIFHARRREDGSRGVPVRNVWTVGAAGTDQRRLTTGTRDEYHAVPSPDGRRLVFVSELNGSRDLWIADADGANPLPLTDDPGLEDHPAWSPDSRRIAYAAFPKEGGSFDLWIINADGTGRRRLTSTAANECFPAWHPDGDRLVFVTDAGGSFDLHTLDLQDGHTVPLVVSPDHEVRPAFSPDGSRLAFARWPVGGRSSDATLWIADARGGGAVQLTDAPAPATHPAWSPDGRALAFQHHAASGWEIWRLDLGPTLAAARGANASDTVALRNGQTLSGALADATLGVRAAYGTLVLRAAGVSGLLFDDHGLAHLSLTNGDSVSGVLTATDLRLAIGGRTETIPVERIARVALRGGGPTSAAGFRALMRNGDALSVGSPGSLRLRVGGQVVAVETARIASVEFDDGGGRARVLLVAGDRLEGDLVGGRLEVVLAAGPRLALDPGALRALSRIGTGG